MRINQINTIPKTKAAFFQSKININFTSNVKNDTFSKENKSESKKAYEDLVKAAEIMGFEGDEDEKVNLLITKTQELEMLGSGIEGKVYAIPHTNLVLKARHGFEAGDLTKKAIDKINEQDRANNVLLKGEKYQIMRKISGADRSDARISSSMEIFEIITENMPQIAYNDLIKKIAKIHQAGLFLDNLGDNFIIDIQNEKFEPLDNRTTSNYCGYSHKKTKQKKKCLVNPISCACDMLKIHPVKSTFPMVFKKILKATASDCENFDTFIIDNDVKRYLKNNEIFEAPVAELKKLETKKKILKAIGYNSALVKAKLKKQIDVYNNKLDTLVQDQDCHISKEDLLQLKKLIDINVKIRVDSMLLIAKKENIEIADYSTNATKEELEDAIKKHRLEARKIKDKLIEKYNLYI